MKISNQKSNIQLTKNTRLNQVNWNNLPFGKLFSDHMFSMDYMDGKWINQSILPYGDLKISPAISALHYGQSCFEGMKAHRNINNEIVLFRPYENAKKDLTIQTKECVCQKLMRKFL